MKNFSANKNKYLILPLLIIVIGIAMYFVNGGFNFDVEFMGGIRMQVDLGKDVNNSEIADFVNKVLADNKVDGKVTVQSAGEGGGQVVIKTPPVEEEMKNKIFGELKTKY